uniref:Ig-like domain-containing protein n=1 Tax=Rhinolophus ferrumequinum TaxID=59479 RepID=A0A671FBN4_RHIFE
MRFGDKVQLLEIVQRSHVLCEHLPSWDAHSICTQLPSSSRDLGLVISASIFAMASARSQTSTDLSSRVLVPPSPALLAVLCPAQAIVVYTDREVHGAVGSRVTLHCSFWSSEWVSDDISFTWRYQPEGGRDAISIFHYAKGQPYIDEVGTFKERIQWVGDPRWKDGSIVIHNLDYSDNGTFTCDVKNPPDIVGKTSKVTLYVFEKGARGHGTGGQGTGVWEAGQGGVRKDCAAGGGGQMPAVLCPSGSGRWAEGSLCPEGARERPLLAPHSAPLPSQCPLATAWCWGPSSGAFWAGCCCCCCSSTWSGTAGSAGRRPCRGGSGKGRQGPLEGGEARGDGRLRPPCGGSGRAAPTAPLSLQCHGEGEISQAWEGLVQARPAGTSYPPPLPPPGFLGAQGLILPCTGPKDCVFGACPSGTEKKGTLIPRASTPGHLHPHPLHPPACPSASFFSDPPCPPSGGPAPHCVLPANTRTIQIRLSSRVY